MIESTSLSTNAYYSRNSMGRGLKTNFSAKSSQGNNYGGGPLRPNLYSKSGKTTIMCDYCKRPEHTKEKCYKLHGYPTSMKNQSNDQISRQSVPNSNQYNVGSQNYK